MGINDKYLTDSFGTSAFRDLSQHTDIIQQQLVVNPVYGYCTNNHTNHPNQVQYTLHVAMHASRKRGPNSKTHGKNDYSIRLNYKQLRFLKVKNRQLLVISYVSKSYLVIIRNLCIIKVECGPMGGMMDKLSFDPAVGSAI